MQLPALNGKTGYLYVFDGIINIPEEQLNLSGGDALLIEDTALSVKAGQTADLIYFVLDKLATVSRNGLYAH